MNWRRFLIAVVAGIAIATGLALVFRRWPELAQSPWTMLALFLFAILCSRLMRRFLRP